MDHSPYASPQAPGRPRPTMVRYAVLVGLCLIATIAYVQRNSISVAESTIRKELELSEQQMGWAISAFFLSYALFQLPAGWIGHMLGSRRGLAVLSLVWSAVTGLMAVAGGFLSLASVRFGMGAAQAGVFPCAANSISKWMPLRRRSLACGALGSFMSVGGALGAAATGFLLIRCGWQWMYVIYAVPGVLWAIWFWCWFRDTPDEHAAVNQEERHLIHGDEPVEEPEERGQRTPWGEILRSPAMWAIGGQQFFRGAGYIFFASWFATYLQETRGVSIETSGVLNSLPLLAVVVGSLSGGVVSDWLLAATLSRRVSRQYLAAASMLGCAGLIFWAYFIPDATLAVLVISGGSFVAAFAGPCAYTITMDLGGRHVTMVFSFMNMCGNIGAVAFPAAVPWLVALHGGWDAVLFVFGGIYVAGALCWLAFDAQRSIVSAT